MGVSSWEFKSPLRHHPKNRSHTFLQPSARKAFFRPGQLLVNTFQNKPVWSTAFHRTACNEAWLSLSACGCPGIHDCCKYREVFFRKVRKRRVKSAYCRANASSFRLSCSKLGQPFFYGLNPFPPPDIGLIIGFGPGQEQAIKFHRPATGFLKLRGRNRIFP